MKGPWSLLLYVKFIHENAFVHFGIGIHASLHGLFAFNQLKANLVTNKNVMILSCFISPQRFLSEL
jgi:hypothetical protein